MIAVCPDHAHLLLLLSVGSVKQNLSGTCLEQSVASYFMRLLS